MIKTDFVIIDASNKAIERACYGNTTLDIRHVRAAVQCVAGTMQFVRNIKRWLMPFACLEIISDDLHMTGRLLREDIQQDRIHLKSRLFFDRIYLRLRCDRENCSVRITFSKCIGSRHEQVDISRRFNTNFELLYEFRHSRRGNDNEINHRRCLNQRSID